MGIFHGLAGNTAARGKLWALILLRHTDLAICL